MLGRVGVSIGFVLLQIVTQSLFAASLSVPGPHAELTAYLYYANIFIKPNISKAAPLVRSNAISLVTRLVYREVTSFESPPPDRRIATLKTAVSMSSACEQKVSSVSSRQAMLPCAMAGKEIEHLIPVERVIRFGLEQLACISLSPEVRATYGQLRWEVELLLDNLAPVDEKKQWIASLKDLDTTEGRSELFQDCCAMSTETSRLRTRLTEFHRLLSIVAPADVSSRLCRTS
jgi:hypothetical protein